MRPEGCEEVISDDEIFCKECGEQYENIERFGDPYPDNIHDEVAKF